MGYYAYGGGFIEFEKKLDENVLDKICEVASEVFMVGFSGGNKNNCTEIELSHDYDKYYSDEVEDVLNTIAGLASIREASIEFTGEDDCSWKYIYDEDQWFDVPGHIVYDGEELKYISDEALLDECERRGLLNNKTYALLRVKRGD